MRFSAQATRLARIGRPAHVFKNSIQSGITSDELRMEDSIRSKRDE
jgi:hypothetical protein